MPRVISVSAAQSQISTDITNPAADGVAVTTVYVTVKQERQEDGEPLNMQGLAASECVITVTPSTGVTITQPTGLTDQNGSTQGSFVSTNAATVSVGATVLGQAVTGNATVVVGGGAPPTPPPGDPFFTETFTGLAFNNADGFVWGGLGTNVSIVNFSGRDCLRFRFGPNADLEDSSAEQRFNMGRDLSELWLEYDIHYPSNYVHRNQSSGSTNNKAIRIWGDSYTRGNKVGASTFYDSTGRLGNSKMRGERAINAGGSMSASTPTESPDAAIAPALNEWVQYRWHFKYRSDASTNDGVIQLWVNGTLVLDWTDLQQYYDATVPYWNNGYLMGWSNSGFLAQTDIHISVPKWYDTDPGW